MSFISYDGKQASNYMFRPI